jgi:hypothetical protein
LPLYDVAIHNVLPPIADIRAIRLRPGLIPASCPNQYRLSLSLLKNVFGVEIGRRMIVAENY